MKLRHLLTFVLALAALPTLLAFDVASHVPKNTMLIGRVKLADVRDSALAKKLLETHATKMANISNFMTDYVGLDLYALDTVWMVAPKKDHGVVIVQGTFDKDKIESRFGYLPNVTVLQRPGCLFAAQFTDEKKPDLIKEAALLDSACLVIGNKTEVDTYLETIKDPTQLLLPSAAAVKEVVESKHHLAATLFGDLSKWGDFDRNIAMFASSVHLIADVSEDVEGSVAIRTQKPEQAKALGNLVTGVVQLKALDPVMEGKPLIRGALKAASVAVTGSTATLSTKLSGRDIQERLATNN